MPQLLHFLRVDQHTCFNVASGALVSAAASEAEAAQESGSAAAAIPASGESLQEKPFLNNSDRVRFTYLTIFCYYISLISWTTSSSSCCAQDIDWGSLDVFSCSASCAAAPPPSGSSSSSNPQGWAYVEELVMIQPPVYRDN